MSSGAKNGLVSVDLNEKTGISGKWLPNSDTVEWFCLIEYILVVTLNRPPVNSLNLELLKDIASTLDDLESSRSRGMILTSVNKIFKFF